VGRLELAAYPRGLALIEFAGVDQWARESEARDKIGLKTALEKWNVHDGEKFLFWSLAML